MKLQCELDHKTQELAAQAEQIQTLLQMNRNQTESLEEQHELICKYFPNPFEGDFADEQPTYQEVIVENQRLKEFARAVVRVECWSYPEPDGFELQELAERLNLIEKHINIDDSFIAVPELPICDSFFNLHLPDILKHLLDLFVAHFGLFLFYLRALIIA